MMRMTDMVKHLLIINIIFFIGSYLVPNSTDLLALHYFENDKFKFWQPITHMFMHAGFGHILFNMFTLIMFGSALEQMWGEKKFLFFYFSCGIGSFLLQTGIHYLEFHHSLNLLIENGIDKQEVYQVLNEGKYNTDWIEYLSSRNFDGLAKSFLSISLGASGATSGLLVGYAFLFPNSELSLLFFPVPIKAKYFVMGIFGLDLFLGMQGSPLFGSGNESNIGHFAHLGGALIGFIMMWYWKKNQFDKNRWDR